MEAERELPPVLQVAFARHPRAREGWDAMSPSRRRGHLFGIFYYRTPDAQGRRIDKMLEDATVLAEKISHKDHKGKRANSWDYRLAVVILEAVRTANARAGVPASHARTLLSSTFYRTMTNVTPRAVFVCYTAVNAFATVCSLSGDPVGSAPPPPFPARRSVPAPISMRAAVRTLVSLSVIEEPTTSH